MEEYNAKQTRADRKIHDYYEHIKNDGHIKPFYEIVVQFGDIDSCGLKSGNWEKAKQIIYAVHEDTDNVHIHFGMNTVSYVDGSMYSEGYSDYYRLVSYIENIVKAHL